MLFKRKENKESTKAKFSMFAKKSKDDAGEVKAPSVKVVSPKTTKTEQEGARALKETVAMGKVSAHILERPRITEKATNAAAGNVYVFDVAGRSNKTEVAAAVKDIYGVTPIAVRTAKVAKKISRNRRGQTSITGGGKKAYVTLKKGDTIELV